MRRATPPAAGLRPTSATADLMDASPHAQLLSPALRPLAPGWRLAGPAFPVGSAGGDNLWLHRALEAAAGGDVLVAAFTRPRRVGYWGEIMTTAALARGLGGLVLDGCARDAAALRRLGFPVFARGLCPRAASKRRTAAGELAGSVRIGGVRIEQGDLVCADEDGVVVVPRDHAAQALAAALRLRRRSQRLLARVRTGALTLDLLGLR